MLVKCYFFKSERGLESLSRGYAPGLQKKTSPGLESCLVSAAFKLESQQRESGSRRLHS